MWNSSLKRLNVFSSSAPLKNQNKTFIFIRFLLGKIVIERESPACIERHNHKFQQSAWNRNLFRELRRADLRGPRRDRHWIYGRWIMRFVRLGVEGTPPMESERPREMNKIPKDILALKIDDAAWPWLRFLVLVDVWFPLDVSQALSRQWRVIAYYNSYLNILDYWIAN